MQNRLLVLAGAMVGLMAAAGSLSADVQNEHQKMTLIEGDIFVSRATTLGSSGSSLQTTTHQTRGLSLTNGLSLWPNGIAVYELDDSLSNFSSTAVTQAVEYWNANSSISLVERSDPSAPQTSDYISFIDGPGCASWVGRQGQSQEIWVSEFCTTGSMIHEIGHALGLLHEHTRADRDQHVQVVWENIEQDKTFNFDINQAGTEDLGAYDYDSIMHYGEYFFSSNGLPTLVPVNAPADVVIGQREKLSVGDLAAIDTLYGTDLSLSATTSQLENNYQLTVMVTNQGQRGAHQIAVKMASNGAITSFISGDAWGCENRGDELVCELALLDSGASSTIELYSDTELNISQLEPLLTSKTHDFEISNNGFVENDEVLPVAAALGEDSSGRTTSGGGGALDLSVLAGLLLLLLFHRCSTVIRSSGRGQMISRYAYSHLSTSSCGTPRSI